MSTRVQASSKRVNEVNSEQHMISDPDMYKSDFLKRLVFTHVLNAWSERSIVGESIRWMLYPIVGFDFKDHGLTRHKMAVLKKALYAAERKDMIIELSTNSGSPGGLPIFLMVDGWTPPFKRANVLGIAIGQWGEPGIQDGMYSGQRCKIRTIPWRTIGLKKGKRETWDYMLQNLLEDVIELLDAGCTVGGILSDNASSITKTRVALCNILNGVAVEDTGGVLQRSSVRNKIDRVRRITNHGRAATVLSQGCLSHHHALLGRRLFGQSRTSSNGEVRITHTGQFFPLTASASKLAKFLRCSSISAIYKEDTRGRLVPLPVETRWWSALSSISVLYQEYKKIVRLLQLLKKKYWKNLPTAAREAYEEAATIMTPQFETQLKTVISALHPLLTLCDYLQNDGISAMQGLIRMGEVYAQIESCELLNGDSLKWIRYRKEKALQGTETWLFAFDPSKRAMRPSFSDLMSALRIYCTKFKTFNLQDSLSEIVDYYGGKGDHASLEHAELSRYWGHFARGPGRRSSLSRYLFALSVTPSGTHGIERCFSMAKSLTRPNKSDPSIFQDCFLRYRGGLILEKDGYVDRGKQNKSSAAAKRYYGVPLDHFPDDVSDGNGNLSEDGLQSCSLQSIVSSNASVSSNSSERSRAKSEGLGQMATETQCLEIYEPRSLVGKRIQIAYNMLPTSRRRGKTRKSRSKVEWFAGTITSEDATIVSSQTGRPPVQFVEILWDESSKDETTDRIDLSSVKHRFM